jgi:uncharacterized RDD family membrane protein YckC
MFPNQPNSSRPFDDHHTIDTPEQTRLEFAIAGIGTRFLALTLDLLIQGAAGVVLIIIVVLLSFTGLRNRVPLSGQWIAALLIGFAFLSHFGYFTVFEILWRGQTPGKRMVHVRVIKDSGRTLSASEAILRNLMRIVDQLPALYAVGILSALLTAQNQRLGDLMAGSIVVREASLSRIRPSNVRSRMASEILERLQARSMVHVDNGLSAESALETLANGLRSRNGYL